MNIKDLKKKFKAIADLKKNKSFDTYTLRKLRTLPTFNGLVELSFKNTPFYMMHISNDDAVPLKYLWRNKYEHLSLSLWYDMTRKDGYFFDVGAHTGIYSIIPILCITSSLTTCNTTGCPTGIISSPVS
mgnify:CR=1 FL=1